MTHPVEKATIFHHHMRLRIWVPSFRILEEVVWEHVQAKMMQTVQNCPGLLGLQATGYWQLGSGTLRYQNLLSLGLGTQA